MDMRYGLMSSSMPGSYEEVIRASGEVGFHGVELDIGPEYEENPLWSAEGRKQLAGLLSRAGLQLASVCLGACWTYSLASPDAGVRKRAHAFTRDALQWCAELGAGVILVPITPGEEQENPEVARARWTAELRRLAPLAEQHQVCLAAENVGRGSGRSADALLEIVEGVNSPFVKIYYDFGNGLSLGGVPRREIARLGPWIAQIHAKDPGGQYMGEGWLDMAGVAAAIKAIGYDGWIVLETPATDDPREAAARNLRFIRELF